MLTNYNFRAIIELYNVPLQKRQGPINSILTF